MGLPGLCLLTKTTLCSLGAFAGALECTGATSHELEGGTTETGTLGMFSSVILNFQGKSWWGLLSVLWGLQWSAHKTFRNNRNKALWDLTWTLNESEQRHAVAPSRAPAYQQTDCIYIAKWRSKPILRGVAAQRKEGPALPVWALLGREVPTQVLALFWQLHPFQGGVCFKADRVKYFNYIINSICSDFMLTRNSSDYTLASWIGANLLARGFNCPLGSCSEKKLHNKWTVGILIFYTVSRPWFNISLLKETAAT